MKPSIIVYKKLPDSLVARLRRQLEVVEVDSLAPEVVARHADAFASAVGLLGASEKVDGALLAKMPALRVASTISVGYDNYDVEALSHRHIALMHTPTVLTETVADTIMMLILTTARRTTEVAERVKAGEWTRCIGSQWFGVDVHHKTLGIIGMGRIGMALAKRAHLGFGMPILYHARKAHPEAESAYQARYCELDILLAESDFVCSILPLTEQTRHKIGARQFAQMKPSAIFINAGRGPVVDEQALIAALQNGTIHAAGLDVFEKEPLPVDSPLLGMANVVALPHIGSATHETRFNMAANAVDNLLNALAGNVAVNCVNPQAVLQP